LLSLSYTQIPKERQTHSPVSVIPNRGDRDELRDFHPFFYTRAYKISAKGKAGSTNTSVETTAIHREENIEYKSNLLITLLISDGSIDGQQRSSFAIMVCRAVVRKIIYDRRA